MMKNILLSALLSFGFSISSIAQEKTRPETIQFNRLIDDVTIKQNEQHYFKVKLAKDTYYRITVVQQGIDLVVSVVDSNAKSLAEVDSPNGMFGPEKILFSPENEGVFKIAVKPLDEDTNAKAGKYTVAIEKVPKTLKKIPVASLLEDFNILQNAYYETRVGLWYNSRIQFDSICKVQKSKITAAMDALEFYRILAPVVAFTKEGHCNIKISDETSAYLKQKGTYLPLGVKIIDNKVYVINDLDQLKLKGLILTKINGENVSNILNQMLSIEPADGFNMTSKYRWIEGAFSKYYARYYPASPFFALELLNPKNGEKVVYDHVPAYSAAAFNDLYPKITATIPNYSFKESSAFSIDPAASTAVITVNTFNLGRFDNGRKGFQEFLENAFAKISAQGIKHLIIDIRKNEGGEQGMEDHLLSYLISEEYKKYKYVEIPGFTYSFLQYTNYENQTDNLRNELKEDFSLNNDGRYLNIPGHYVGEGPNKNNFKGDLYILISGLTFSGGSEFAALAKNYTSAKFIGEETGGGYYGNSSGTFLSFTLPNSKIMGRIPLCKFVVEPKDFNIPFGRGVLPDFPVPFSIDDYLTGTDREMELVKNLIAGKKEQRLTKEN